MANPELKLNFQFSFQDLLHSSGLARLDETFLRFLQAQAPELYEKLLTYRKSESAFTPIETSELLISCAIHLEQFIAILFQIDEPLAISQAKTTSYNPISTFKKYFVLRRAKKEVNKGKSLPSFSELNTWLTNELENAPVKAADQELAIALLATHYLASPDQYAEQINQLVAWCTQALITPEGQAHVKNWVSFQLPERIDYANLVPIEPIPNDKLNRLAGPKESQRLRDGFKLTDPRMSAREVQDEVNYCIYCHDHEGDFCSRGFPVKKGDPTQGFKKNPLDTTLTGCPLEEKISEMNFLKKDGHTIASLAMVMVDNPMCPATGHRICNDCMKSCIYQKQTPVNVPQIETRVLTDVLDLPWGVEIYDLLTRWNPLRPQQWVMKPYNGLKVLIAGMGPAGFTLAHHLLLEGFAVVGFDGLKIEPLSNRLLKNPIRCFADLKESLDERIMAGFGGVAEYGITVRWDKNFLKLIYLSLARRPYFQVFGGVRFGGTIVVEDAWEMGFDHLAVAVGAGLPKALPIPGSLAPGMRQANDFLMALQLGNAAKASSLTNLQVRLPAVVIGGGLTGVDTATEVRAYYISQVEKISERYKVLVNHYGKETIEANLDNASKQILNEYLQHAEAIKAERERASELNQPPNFLALTQQWGGVTIAYRRALIESPAYINNHEELRKALEEGIYYAEGLEPIAVKLDEFGQTQALVCQRRIRDQAGQWQTTIEEVILPARSILVATGTQPNTAYEFEHRGTFNKLNLQYQHYEDEAGELTIAHGVSHCKDGAFGPFTSYHKADRRVSLIGDTHPVFHGSVVKAIASGLRTYPKILTVLEDKLNQNGNDEEYAQFAAQMQYLFTTKVKTITRKTDKVIELSVQAPLAAKHFKPGHFYRLQNFETLSPYLLDTLLQIEPTALVAAESDPKQGCLNFYINETTTGAKLCSILKPDEPVSLMGPTGVRSKVPNEHETILIIGTQFSFPFVRSYGKQLRDAGNQVIYLAQLQNSSQIYGENDLKNATDKIVWLLKEESQFEPSRANDRTYTHDSAVAFLTEMANNHDQEKISQLKLPDVDRIFLVGDTNLLRHFQQARKNLFKQYFVKEPKVFASVYGNMQCMLKGVCAQCLQWQIDPETGARTKAVFACSWQDQPLEIIDIDHIDARLSQNRLQEHLSQLWIDYLFEQGKIHRI